LERVSTKEDTDVNVYLLIDKGQAKSLAIIASEPREFVIVNIVGNIDLEKLHQLEGQFGVPELQIEGDKKASPKAAPAPARRQRPRRRRSSQVELASDSWRPNTPMANMRMVTPSAIISNMYCALSSSPGGRNLRITMMANCRAAPTRKGRGERGIRLAHEPAVEHDEHGNEDAAQPRRRTPVARIVRAAHRFSLRADIAITRSSRDLRVSGLRAEVIQ
jgi:hypothetical protein